MGALISELITSLSRMEFLLSLARLVALVLPREPD